MPAYNEKETGIITGAGHGTMRDGPGWRTIIHLKGCNFTCPWCSSPDTISPDPEILYFPSRIKRPEKLISSCPHGALSKANPAHTASASPDTAAVILNSEKCAVCPSRDCAPSNIDGSIELTGRPATVAQLLEETLQYTRAHQHYGVTLSGGEPTAQWNFYLQLLKAFKTNNIHTAVETNASNEKLPESFPWLDLAICDLKTLDPDAHMKWTSQPNETVLRNIQAAAAAPDTQLRVRIPVIPGVNDTTNIQQTINFLAPMRRSLTVELLPFHKLGAYKWAAIGKTFPMENTPRPDDRTIAGLEQQFTAAGLTTIRS